MARERTLALALAGWRRSFDGCCGRVVAAVLVAASFLLPTGAHAQQEPPATTSFESLAHVCAPHVDVTTLAALVRVESGFNPYAIGVVGARLQYQPRSYAQALATASALAARGYDFSVGLGQVNVRNLGQVGESLATIFNPCRNLRASSMILQRCFARSSARAGDTQGALRDALSCYYSGNFMTGYRQGYVARILAGAYTNWQLAHARERPVNAKPPPLAPDVPTPASHDAALLRNARHHAFAARSIADTSACASGSSRLQVTVRCAGNRHHWCTRCLDTASLAGHGAPTIVH